jgi:hypothetical protein
MKKVERPYGFECFPYGLCIKVWPLIEMMPKALVFVKMTFLRVEQIILVKQK